MVMLQKLYRFVVHQLDLIGSEFRIAKFKVLYPDCDLNGCYLERGVDILCTTGAKLVLKNCIVSKGAAIIAKHGGVISISDTFIGRNSVIVACSKIEISSNCQIAEMVVIRDQNHRFDLHGQPIASQGLSVKPIKIGENVWLGAKSTVLPGAMIGNGAVIGANSVVISEIPPRSVAVGSPARVKREY